MVKVKIGGRELSGAIDFGLLEDWGDDPELLPFQSIDAAFAGKPKALRTVRFVVSRAFSLDREALRKEKPADVLSAFNALMLDAMRPDGEDRKSPNAESP